MRYARRRNARRAGRRGRAPKAYRRRNGRGRALVGRRPPRPNAFAPLGLNEPVCLRFVEAVTVDPAAGLTADYVYRANSMTTPNYTFGGHQPYGFDQMCGGGVGAVSPMYTKYTVVGSKITVRMNNPDNGVNSQALAAILLRKDPGLINLAPAVIMEQPGNGGFKVIDPSAQGGRNTAIMTKKLSVKKFFSITRVVGNPDYSGSSTADVAADNTAYYHIVVGPMVGATDLAVRTMIVTIDYFAVFQQPKILAQS